MAATLHYIFDPLCGWCYAASPLLRALRENLADRIELRLAPGLLFPQPTRMESDWRSHILQSDQRIAELARVGFGEAYLARVRDAAELVFHSQPPATAVLAAESVQPGRGLAMLEAIQHAHYLRGLDVVQPETLTHLALDLGLPAGDFALAMARHADALPEIVARARQMLAESGGRGFPTFVFEHAGQRVRLDHSMAYGKPQVFVEQVSTLMEGVAP